MSLEQGYQENMLGNRQTDHLSIEMCEFFLFLSIFFLNFKLEYFREFDAFCHRWIM